MTLIQSPADMMVTSQHVAVATHVGATNGTGVDTTQFEYAVFLITATAASAFTSMSVSVDHSDNNSTWTTANTYTISGNFDGHKALYVRTVPYKQYVRITVTAAGGSWYGGVIAIQTGPQSSVAASGTMSWEQEILGL